MYTQANHDAFTSEMQRLKFILAEKEGALRGHCAFMLQCQKTYGSQTARAWERLQHYLDEAVAASQAVADHAFSRKGL